MSAQTAPALVPFALKDAPALIETVFPVQKVSFEAQKERKSGSAQTLTSLAMFWKGRKPLILVRAIVLGSLLPATEDARADLDIFEKLMAFDDEGLARRALAANAFSASKLPELISVPDPEAYFSGRGWRRDLTSDDKLVLYRQALATFDSYEAKAAIAKRPEEVDQEWLYAPVWAAVNRHYAQWGLDAHSFPELIEQLGMLRYGHRPRVGDTFSGGGSIPFEAARLGCDVYASDLNPIACMLTWGALNIIGASPERRAEIETAQRRVANAVDKEITALGIEHDKEGNRAKAYLYCLEARCPETGWLVPLAPSWVISKARNVVVQLRPDFKNKRFDIRIASGVSAAEMKAAEQGTIQGGEMIYTLDNKVWRTPIKTLRGDYRQEDGSTGNRLRHWEKEDFKPHPDDVFQERLYAIQWITKETLNASRQETFFAAPTDADLKREQCVEEIVAKSLIEWQDEGLIPDMAIEPGDETTRLFRERGWTHWHHLFNARALLLLVLLNKRNSEDIWPAFNSSANYVSKLCYWATSGKRFSKADPSQQTGGASDNSVSVFVSQALNPFYSYSQRAFSIVKDEFSGKYPSGRGRVASSVVVKSEAAAMVNATQDIWITDPPYADAVNYHEITEFFIAWLRKNPPKPFDKWIWDSRRALAIKGSGDEFRHGMVAAYKAMTEYMPDNGMQCVMFTHQSTTVWGDLIGIFWAAGLQVVAAWYIATETSSELKKGGYVQGTVTLMLKKRPAGERVGFKQRLLPAVRKEVEKQIETMLHLNDSVRDQHGEPVFNDSDLQMAGYAAALKVLTAYTKIGDEDVTTFALRPRAKGEITVVDEIVQQAAETASNLLVPEGLAPDVWQRLSGIERFMLRMMDMETAGAAKLDNYQNFAKAFRVGDYARVMGSMKPNSARLKRVTEFASRDLGDTTELGATHLGQLIIGLQQMLKDTEAQIVVDQLRADMADFLEIRPHLVELLTFIEHATQEPEVRSAAEVLGARLKNLRLGD
ncbi:anti-phage-associated DUF1156 domain-containing protein [Castellaniella sp. S9]|uniref:anti-phage-associated DUF1156 domain-containing protein n=1 Tax=Castellaniella sp. S9 TaxID=2993652 RepID=UPI0022B469C1|nr:anti-phage-associated DUF1156 domain-containing protein [Castellaniella sp. S9]